MAIQTLFTSTGLVLTASTATLVRYPEFIGACPVYISWANTDSEVESLKNRHNVHPTSQAPSQFPSQARSRPDGKLAAIMAPVLAASVAIVLGVWLMLRRARRAAKESAPEPPEADLSRLESGREGYQEMKEKLGYGELPGPALSELNAAQDPLNSLLRPLGTKNIILADLPD
jgi:hypothetical protein